MEQKQFKQDAKSIVDMLFDAKLFKDILTRDDFNGVEDFIAYLMESNFNSYQRITKLMEKVKDNENQTRKSNK